MEEALKLIENNKIYKKILNEVYKKYKRFGKVTGVFKMKPKNKNEMAALSNFDSEVIYNGEAKIKCKTVEELFLKKLGDNSFIEFLTIVSGGHLETNKEIKKKEEEKLQNFFEEIIHGSEEGRGKLWFKTLISSKNYGYYLLIRKYNESKTDEDLKALVKDVILIINSLNELPAFKNEFINIAIFSSNKTKDPHFFDGNRYTGKLFVYGLKFIFNKEASKSLDEINELYYEAGILKDEISNHSTIFNFKAFDCNNKEIKGIKYFNEWKEPLEISISNLIKVDYFKVYNDEVFIFENPAVFHEILKKCDKESVSIMCSSGVLNLSSYMILNKIKDLKTIYYGGDFDPEGLLIADKLKRKYGDKFKFLLYDKKIYKSILSDNIISSSRLSILDNIHDKELYEIKECMEKEKKAAYEELLIDKYLEKIKSG